jgi:hypothetical protein
LCGPSGTVELREWTPDRSHLSKRGNGDIPE